jgi:CRP-like cAMP-binding protein
MRFDLSEIEKEIFEKGFGNTYAVGEMIYEQGDTPVGIYYLEDGVVVSIDSETGKRTAIPMKSVIGLREFLNSELYKDSALVLSDAKVIVLPKKGLVQMLSANAYNRAFLVKNLFSTISGKNRIAYE